MTKSLEKIIFIDLTCKQLGILDSNHPEFIQTWDLLTENDKEEYAKLAQEIHQIWSSINMPPIINLGDKRVNTVFEYNEVIDPVDPRILQACSDYKITLKDELTEDL